MEISPKCNIDIDLLRVAEKIFPGLVEKVKLADDSSAYQLTRLSEVGQVISQKVTKRLKGKQFNIEYDWDKALENLFGPAEHDEVELRAREEKIAALNVLANSRFSVLIGPAGTGKTTLLSLLCAHPDISAGDVLLLAPTGKARIRMETIGKESGTSFKGYTIAQFLSRCDRYEGDTGYYHLSDKAPEETADTVIIDESSMLTEEMLGALLDSLKGTKRVILVGDPHQLPPIGSGRPFVDIISMITPDHRDSIFPKVGDGYAELTVQRRQQGVVREDIQFAKWFGGTMNNPGEDEILQRLYSTEDTDHLRFIEWNDSTEIQEKVLRVLSKELGLQDIEDIQTFDKTLGAKISGEASYFNSDAAKHAESWQILSPVRARGHGVNQLNRFINNFFRDHTKEFAERTKKIPKPMGSEQIVYGDKVINIRNHMRHNVYPKEGAAKYVANGEIGIVTGRFVKGLSKSHPKQLNVAFSSQPGFSYTYSKKDFSDEHEPVLELAYALTVHKAQGSEFRLVFFILPNPCRLLSRELLYTALTRQQDRIIVFHQGNLSDIWKYSSDEYSEIYRRYTNLFTPPNPVEINGSFFEDRLIHRTVDNIMVRSKSEVIIADRLHDSGIIYQYEAPLTLSGITRFPDFTIDDDESGYTYYWEHCGMMYDPKYRDRWETKLQWYKDNGILPRAEGEGKNGILIVTQDDIKGGISSKAIQDVINETILGIGVSG